MNTLKRILTSLFLLFSLDIFAVHSFAQKKSANCFEIKYFDFFGLDKIGDINWSDKEIDDLLKINYLENFNGTRFFIPLLVFQLRNFYPDCNHSPDLNRFNKLFLLYFKVRLKDDSVVKNKSIADKINFIRADFYNLVDDQKLLPLLKYTMDDGPLYGEIPKRRSNQKILENIVTDFGMLIIAESSGKVSLTAVNKSNKIIWMRIMKGANPERYLKDLKFNDRPIEKTSLATIVSFHSEGERLNLYLKPDGKFMYYYHSW